jgi:hypothetical protein
MSWRNEMAQWLDGIAHLTEASADGFNVKFI